MFAILILGFRPLTSGNNDCLYLINNFSHLKLEQWLSLLFTYFQISPFNLLCLSKYVLIPLIPA